MWPSCYRRRHSVEYVYYSPFEAETGAVARYYADKDLCAELLKGPARMRESYPGTPDDYAEVADGSRFAEFHDFFDPEVRRSVL